MTQLIDSREHRRSDPAAELKAERLTLLRVVLEKHVRGLSRRRTEALIDRLYWVVAPLIVGIVDAERERALAPIREFHRRWGDTECDELDELAMWEDLGRLLGDR